MPKPINRWRPDYLVRRLLTLATGCWLLAYLFSSLAAAQSSGWLTQTTAHFTVRYLPQSERLVQSINPQLEPTLARICLYLQTTPPARITVVMAPDPASFQRLQGGAPPWVAGMAYPDKDTIYLRPFTGLEIRHNSLPAVVAHEITHLVFHEKLAGHSAPLWLNEGLAVFMAQEPLYARAERLVTIALRGQYIPFRALADAFPDSPDDSAIAYAQSGDFVMFIINTYGDRAFRQYLDLLAQGQDPDAALQAAFHHTLYELETTWFDGVRRSYGLIPGLTGGALLWFLISVLAVYVYLRRYRDTRRQMKAWAAAEAGYDYSARPFQPVPPPEPPPPDLDFEAGEWEEGDELNEDGEWEDDDDDEPGYRH